MNHIAAYKLLTETLAPYRELSLRQLGELVGESTTQLVQVEGDGHYSVSIWVRWENNAGGSVRVRGAVSDAAWGGRFDTLTETFLVSADGMERSKRAQFWPGS